VRLARQAQRERGGQKSDEGWLRLEVTFLWSHPLDIETDFPPFGEGAAADSLTTTGCSSGSQGGDQGEERRSGLRGCVLDGVSLPLTERFLLLCSRPLNELAFLLKTALAAYQATKAEGAWGGGGGGGGGSTPMKKVRPYRVASAGSSSSSLATAAALASSSALTVATGAAGSVLFSPGSASLRKIAPTVSRQHHGPSSVLLGSAGSTGSGDGRVSAHLFWLTAL
jgi:hypothetical protein